MTIAISLTFLVVGSLIAALVVVLSCRERS